MKLLIYTPYITTRIQYVVNYLFVDYLQWECRLTESISDLHAYDGLKLAYATTPVEHVKRIWQHPLLLEQTVRPQTIDLFEWENGLPAFFKTDDADTFIPFDLFAASFYLLTRYEEYISNETDRFGRFKPEQSTAFRGGFLKRPLVNHWMVHLSKKLTGEDDFEACSSRRFSYLATYDIDHAFLFRHKGIYMNLGGFLKDLSKGNLKQSKHRLLTVSRFQKDPYDAYDFLFTLNKRFKLNPYYFILCAEKRSKYDRNIPLANKAFDRLLNRLKQHGIIGLHPSFMAGNNLSMIDTEKKSLESAIQLPVRWSRQHFLLLKFPDTYRALEASGITTDFTMGYAAYPGFRASVSTAYLFFDLPRNRVTSLRIQPFAYMDATLHDYLNLSPQEAEAVIRGLIDEVKAVRGEFVSLWHNNALSNHGKWCGWKAVYYHSLRYALEK
ncbi:MAG: polysaccharide deacetylase family protein [Microbacter sp.]